MVDDERGTAEMATGGRLPPRRLRHHGRRRRGGRSHRGVALRPPRRPLFYGRHRRRGGRPRLLAWGGRGAWWAAFAPLAFFVSVDEGHPDRTQHDVPPDQLALAVSVVVAVVAAVGVTVGSQARTLILLPPGERWRRERWPDYVVYAFGVVLALLAITRAIF